jgi:hypothetical protein
MLTGQEKYEVNKAGKVLTDASLYYSQWYEFISFWLL